MIFDSKKQTLWQRLCTYFWPRPEQVERPSLPKAMWSPPPQHPPPQLPDWFHSPPREVSSSWWASLQDSGPGRLTETKVAGRDFVKFEQFAGDAAEPFNVTMIPAAELGKFQIVSEEFARSSIRRPKAPES